MSSGPNFPVGHELELRADTAAEAHLAETLQTIYADTDERFTEDAIQSLRETFKLGWMMGYRACLNDTQDQLKGLVADD